MARFKHGKLSMAVSDTPAVLSVLCRNTQEERYMPVLEQRQALADYIWGEASELYDQLSPIELLHLIRE